MGMAHKAQDQFKSRLQEKRYEELESKIIEILDRRFVNSGKEEHGKIQRNKEDEDKVCNSAWWQVYNSVLVSGLKSPHYISCQHRPLKCFALIGLVNFSI